MIQKIIQVLILITFLSTVIGSDDDESFYFANSNNKFFFNMRKNCQPNYVFDIDYFKCRLCDANFYLTATELSKNLHPT